MVSGRPVLGSQGHYHLQGLLRSLNEVLEDRTITNSHQRHSRPRSLSGPLRCLYDSSVDKKHMICRKMLYLKHNESTLRNTVNFC